MSLGFIAGNVLGRAGISYIIVFAACCIFCRLRLRESFFRSLRWYSLVAVVVLTILGVAMALSREGGL